MKSVGGFSSLHNFTLHDIAGTILGVVAFPLVLLAPGYLLSWCLDLLNFRSRSFLSRCVFSVPISMSLSGVLITLIARTVSMAAAVDVFILTGAAFMVLLLLEFAKKN